MQSTQNHYLFNQKNRKQQSSFFKFKKRNKTSSCFYSIGQVRGIKASALKVHNSRQLTFLNVSFDKGRLKNFVWWFFQHYGQKKTIQLLEEFKTLGFAYATQGGISLGIDDLKIPPRKKNCLLEADRQIEESLFNYKRGQITGIERFQNLIETWHHTSESLKQEVIHYFEMTDIFNPVYMMAFSGARGNISQVRQLVGMRGLMADPQGQIIDFPIRSNFREGLTLTEYIISTYGARKGIVDTALRTATAGYLTRRLVDVAQHVVVSQFDCGTTRGIFLFDMKEGLKTLYSFKDRLIGRVLAQNLLISEQIKDSQKLPQILAYRNQEISSELANAISQVTNKALVRSTLTCDTRKLVCQLCYGWSLAKGRLVSLGEAVGIIAAQSIGEPGTQLTMRTFHTGGVFSGGISDQILAPSDGIISYLQPIPGTCIRTPQGKIAFLTKAPGSLVFHCPNESKSILNPIVNNVLNNDLNNIQKQKQQEIYQIPAYTILFAKNKQKVFKKQILAQLSAISKQQAIQADAEQMIYAGLEGQVYFSHLNLIEQSNEKHGDITRKTQDWSKIWILSGKIYESPMISSFFPLGGDLVNKNSILNDIDWWTSQKCLIDLESLTSNQQSHLAVGVSKSKNQSLDFSKNSFKQKGVSNGVLKSFLDNQYSLNSFKKFQLKIEITSNRFSDLIFGRSTFSNISSFKRKIMKTNTSIEFTNSFSTSHDYQTLHDIQEQKLMKLSFPFYYPFQQISKKRFFQFLYSTPNNQSLQQPTFIISKKNRMFSRINKLFKKMPKFRKVAIFQLQNKWQPWRIRSKIQPFVKIDLNSLRRTHFKPSLLKKTIHSKIYKINLEKETSQICLKKFNNSKYQKKSFPKYHRLSLRKGDNALSPSVSEYYSERYLKRQKNITNFSSLKSATQVKGSFRFLLKSSDCQIRNWNFQKIFSNKFNNQSLKLAPNNAELFQNASFLIKNSIFHLNIQQIFYKKMTYKFVLEKSLRSDLFWKQQQLNRNNGKNPNQSLLDFDNSFAIEIIPYFAINPNFFLELNIRKSQYTNQNAFSPTSSIQTRVINNRYLDYSNSFSWTTFAHDFFSYFPKMAQTSNNGIFFQGEEIHDPLRKPIFKQQPSSVHRIWDKDLNVDSINAWKKIFLPILQFNTLETYCVIPNLILQQKKQRVPFCFENLSLQTNQDLKPLSPLLAIGISSVSKSHLVPKNLKKDIEFQIKSFFYKISLEENQLRWKNTNKKYKVKNPKTNFQKYSVSFNEFFWLPQENYQLSSLNRTSQNVNVQLQNYFISRQEPILKLLNNQGLKKDIYSNLEGILQYSKRVNQTKTVGETESYSNQLNHFNKNLRTQTFVLNQDLKQFQEMGNHALQTLDDLLQSRFLFAIFQKKTKNRNFFFEIFQQKYKTPSIMKRTPVFVGNRNHFHAVQHGVHQTTGIQCFPILTHTISGIQQPLLSGKLKNPWLSMNQNIERFQYEKMHITLKEGWIYYFDNFSKFNIGNQTFINPGVSFLDNICFNHQAVFIEVLRPVNSVNSKNSHFFQSKKTIMNKNSRFANLNSQSTVQSARDHSYIQLLIRPISFHIFENEEQTKFHLSNLTSKQGDFSFSFLNFKKFSSNLFNQQKATSKFFSSFPLPDIQVKSMLKKRQSTSFLPLQKINVFQSNNSNISIQKKMLPWSLLFQKVDKKQLFPNNRFPSTEFKQILDSSQNRFNKKLISIYTKSYQRKYHPFISMYSLNLCPLTIKGIISSDPQALFQIPLVQLLDFQSKFLQLSVNSNSFTEIQKRLLEILIWKSDVSVNFDKFNSFSIVKPVLESQNPKVQGAELVAPKIMIPFTVVHPMISQEKFERAIPSEKTSFVPIEILKTIGSAAPVPTLIGSYSQKINSFYNQRFSNYSNLAKITNKNKNEFQTPILQQNSQFLHSFPRLKNQLFGYSNGQVVPLQSIGKTSVLSPFDGEIIRHQDESNCGSNKFSHSLLFNANLNSSSNQVSEDAKFLFLTKSDLTTIRFPELLHSVSKDLFKSSFSLLKFESFLTNSKQKKFQALYQKLKSKHMSLQQFEHSASFGGNNVEKQNQKLNNSNWEIERFELKYQNKIYTIQGFQLGLPLSNQKFRLGKFLVPGEVLFHSSGISDSGQIIHLNAKELTLRYAQCISASPNGILHTYNGNFIQKNHPMMTLPFQTLKTGDIVQGIPKIEQYLEARTTQQGRLFVRSLPILMQAIFERYCFILPRETAARQSFLKIQQILVDGVQRVYRSQGISIADKHLEVIVKQMASKVQIVFGGQTGFFPGELVDLDFVERINRKVLVKVHYEPVILGITRASLEVDSFLSAASFQQTTKILARAAIYKQKDYLKGLKENLLIGNLLPAGTGFFKKIHGDITTRQS